MTKRIVLCADDYGQASAISQGILALAREKRLSAVSCLVTAENLQNKIGALMELHDQIDIGLHFNLTEGNPISPIFIDTYGALFPSLSTWLTLSLTGRIKKEAIFSECLAQLDKFHHLTKLKPDFMDGHHHIHQFPFIREAVLAAYDQVFPEKNAYIRLADPKIDITDISNPKKLLIKSLAIGMKSSLEARKIPHNTSFAGVYSFHTKENYADLFKKFLKDLDDNGILMCHPGFEFNQDEDAIAKARFNEYQFLKSSQFAEICKENDVVIQKWQLRAAKSS